MTMRVRRVTPHPTKFARGRGGRKIRYFVPHSMAGYLPFTLRMMTEPGIRQVSANVCIQEDEVVEVVRDADTSYCNTNLRSNQESYTLEVANGPRVGKSTPLTHETAAQWIAKKVIEHGIRRPLRYVSGPGALRAAQEGRAEIIDHRDIATNGTTCPAGNLDNRWITDRVNEILEENDMPTPDQLWKHKLVSRDTGKPNEAEDFITVTSQMAGRAARAAEDAAKSAADANAKLDQILAKLNPTPTE